MAPSAPSPQAMAALARDGVFTGRQAIAAGYTPGAIRHRLQTGQWLALRRGVYVERRRHDACTTDPERHALDAAAAIVL